MSDSSAGLKRALPYAPPPDLGLQIVYQDAHLMAIDKPAGLLSVPGRSADLEDCALHRVQKRLPHALLVHRLDEATSGLLLFALSAVVQKALSAAFETRQIRKTYHARVHGTGLPNKGVINAPIAVDWPRRPLRKIDPTVGQSAITHFAALSIHEHTLQTTCVLVPQTGRTHQLRVHMQHLGHPIVGDRLYGLSHDDAPRLLLHASSLEFQHPIDRLQNICLTSSPPF